MVLRSTIQNQLDPTGLNSNFKFQNSKTVQLPYVETFQK